MPQNYDRHPEVPATDLVVYPRSALLARKSVTADLRGGPRRMHGPGRRPSRLASLAPQGDGQRDVLLGFHADLPDDLAVLLVVAADELGELGWRGDERLEAAGDIEFFRKV